MGGPAPEFREAQKFEPLRYGAPSIGRSMSDLLERLPEKWCGHSGLHELHNVSPDGPEAADEIERLREALRIICEEGCTINDALHVARAALSGEEA